MTETILEKPLVIAVTGPTYNGKGSVALALAQRLPDTVLIDVAQIYRQTYVNEHSPEPQNFSPFCMPELYEKIGRLIGSADNRNVILCADMMNAQTREYWEQAATGADAEFCGLWLDADRRSRFDRAARDTPLLSRQRVEDIVLGHSLISPGPLTPAWSIITTNIDRPAEEAFREALEIVLQQPAKRASGQPARTRAPLLAIGNA